ncbi:MAG: CPBP family intramembrane metalloprotease [Bacteroidales bacterium]|nr:CPBP family intramembrane metalloprotease [Bacteroidales bacterium]
MISKSFKTASNFVKLIFILFSILAGFVIFMVLGIIISIPVFGVDLAFFSDALNPSNPENINLLKFLQSMYSIGLFVIPPIIIAFFFSGKITIYLKISRAPGLALILLSALIILFAFPLINFLLEINQNIRFPESLSAFEELMKQLEEEAEKTTALFLETNTFSVYLVNIIILAIIPAIGEEFLFRGIFQRLFHNWTKNIHIGIWVAAFLFSAMHMQFYGLIPRMVLGALFGYLLYWSQNMWVPIFAHFLNNAFAVTFYYVSGNIAKEAETIGTGKGAISQVLISAILVASLIYIFYRIRKEKQPKNLISIISDNERDSEH